MSKNTITVAGTTYNSLYAAARHYNIAYHVVSNRLRQGWSIDETFGLAYRIDGQGTTLEIDGFVFASIKDAAEQYGVGATTVRNRLTKGWSISEALGLEQRERKKHTFVNLEITVNGVIYNTLKEASRQLDKKYGTIIKRLKDGWTPNEAFGFTDRIPKHNYPGLIYLVTNLVEHKQYVGVSMRSLEARWAQHLTDALAKGKKCNGSLADAILDHGPEAFTIELIVSAKNHVEMQKLEVHYIEKYNTLRPYGYNGNVGGSGSMPQLKHRITLNGKKYPSISAAIRELAIDIPYPTIIQRFKNGWTPEQAFGLEDHVTNTANWGAKSQTIIVNGTTYASLAQACREIASAPDVRLAQTRLARGWTPEEAFNIVPHANQRGRVPRTLDVLNSNPTMRSTTGHRGVSKHLTTGKWQAAFSHKGKRHFVGLFDRLDDAHAALQQARQNVAQPSGSP